MPHIFFSESHRLQCITVTSNSPIVGQQNPCFTIAFQVAISQLTLSYETDMHERSFLNFDCFFFPFKKIQNNRLLCLYWGRAVTLPDYSVVAWFCPSQETFHPALYNAQCTLFNVHSYSELCRICTLFPIHHFLKQLWCSRVL